MEIRLPLTMKYCSTRGGFKGLSFEEAVFAGFKSDGGILLPESIPKVEPATLKSWAKLSYPELVKKIVPLFISEEEIPRDDIDGILDKAFAQFSFPEVVKIARLSNGLNILEMFHGKTLAFKDLAMSCVGQFIDYFLNKRKRHVTILVGTSGDTGSAAIESVRGQTWVDIVVMLPRDRCSKIQELMMTTVIEDNVHIYRVDGTSDDMDVPIKNLFMDESFATRTSLISINSINWTRILIQTAHYFYCYLQMCPSCDDTVEIVVPTGALGNTSSGVIAYMMGLPIEITCAVNVNDIVARTMSNGDFSVSGDVIQTIAPAMDIQVPYNMERLLYLFTEGNTAEVNTIMTEMEKSNKVAIPENIMKKLQKVVSNSHVASDEDIKTTMKGVWESDKYLLCPHTATAAHYHNTKGKKDRPSICLATASPAKFEEAVKACGLVPQPTEDVKKLFDKKTKFIDLERSDNWEKIIREKIEQINKCS